MKLLSNTPNAYRSLAKCNKVTTHTTLEYLTLIIGLAIIEQLKRKRDAKAAATDLYANVEWKPFQTYLLGIVGVVPCLDPRTVYWVVDEVGNTGKSFLTKYLVMNHGAFPCGGKRHDVQCAYNFEDIVVYDLPRENAENKGMYGTIENIKNWCFFSGKYQSMAKYKAGNPHVICFANYYPDKTMISADRLQILKLDHEGNYEIGNEANNWGSFADKMELGNFDAQTRTN